MSVTGISKEEYLTAVRKGGNFSFVCATCVDLAYRTAYDDEQRRKSSARLDVATASTSAVVDDDDDDDDDDNDRSNVQEEIESSTDMPQPIHGDHEFVSVSSNLVVTRYLLSCKLAC